MKLGGSLAQGGLMPADGPGPHRENFTRAVPGRSRAFRAAATHSARVKWLRRVILIGAALTSIGVVWYSWFRSIDIGDAHFSLESFGISGDKVTMEHPVLTGVRRDGKPYEVVADSGVQNPHDPSRTGLIRLNARLRLADDSEMRVLGDTGFYDSNTQSLDLLGNVHIKGATYDLAMKSAAMNFKTNALTSKEPVRLDFNDGWVSADSLSMADNGVQITFLGNVQSQFRQAEDKVAAPTRKED